MACLIIDIRDQKKEKEMAELLLKIGGVESETQSRDQATTHCEGEKIRSGTPPGTEGGQ